MKTPAGLGQREARPEQPKNDVRDGALAERGREESFPDAPEALRADAVAALPEVCALIKRRTGHDFSRYKQSTLGRRVARRVSVLRLNSVQEYVERLHHDLKEIEDLFNDLLIGVTQFFRDPDAFKALETKVIPQLYKRPPSAGPIRVWVSGCATGEEAYSVAILLAEHAEKLKAPVNAMVFATDLDGQALEIARKGEYSEQALEDVSEERVARFFERRKDYFEVKKEIRELCIFSPHSLVKDPPFSRLALISCRNLLIYFESDLQKRLLPLFHFALNPGGYLFLGPSENVAIRSELFQALDAKNRIFHRKAALLTAPVSPPNFERARHSPMQHIQPPHNVPARGHGTTR